MKRSIRWLVSHSVTLYTYLELRYNSTKDCPLQIKFNGDCAISFPAIISLQLGRCHNIFENSLKLVSHDDIIKWKHFPHYWPFVQGIHWSPVNSPHKGQWCRALIFSLICAWINGWLNNRETSDLKCHCAHYDLIVIQYAIDNKSALTQVMR